MTTLPELFFRIRDNGAAVFRLDGQNRDRRVEYEQIAVINTNRGDFKATGDHDLTEAEESAIAAWMAERIALLNRRETDDIPRVIDQINLTAHWAQTKAGDDALEAITDDLLLAMHDLRTVLLRKKSERIARADKG